MPDEEPQWCREAIAGAVEDTIRSLQSAGLLDSFYLAGGTGLALQFGHRLSHDLDFFAPELFEEASLLQRLQGQPGLSVIARAPHTLHATVLGTKVSFLGYAYPLLFPFARFLDVAIADPRDIACMKVSAIASRGTKRDFIDLHVSAERFGLAELLRLFDRKYVQTGYSRIHTLKSLIFFDDAEKDPMPHMLIPLEWSQAKQFFAREVSKLV